MSIIVAIDPGASGGIAWTNFHTKVTECRPMPATDGETLDVLSSLHKIANGDNTLAYLEEVGGFAGSGQPGSAMFEFGSGYGFLRGVLMTLRFRVELVRPQKWQKALGIGNASSLLPENFKERDFDEQKRLKTAAKSEWKRKLKAHAERLYPNQKVTLKTCDALLILDYGIEDCARRLERIYGNGERYYPCPPSDDQAVTV